MEDFITKEESLEILQLNSYRQLKRIVDKCNIKTKSLGIGKPTLYLRTDICKAVDTTKDTKKYAPKKPKQRAKEAKEKREETKKVTTTQKEKGFLDNNPLNETGQKHFEFLREELLREGIYTDKDIGLLQAYCISYQKYINAVNHSAEQLDTVMDAMGTLKVHPYFTVADKCLSQMDKLAKQLGIGARSRIGLEIKEETNESLMAKLLSE